MQLSSNRSYGLLVAAVLVLTGLWLAYDAQAGILQPGWFAGLRSGVWCKTVVYGPRFGTGTFFHYPGKSLTRVTEELGVPAQLRSLYLNPDNRRETVCFDTFREAAHANGKFQAVTQGYADVLADWTEEDYEQAVIMLSLRREGAEVLTAMLQLQQRKLEQSGQP